MTNWNTATRAAYLKTSPENFAGPGSTFPIKDAEDVKNAWDLAGHGDDPVAIRKKVKEIAKRLNLSSHVPGTVQMSAWLGGTDETSPIALFALADAEASGSVFVRNGKVFEVGDYPDKNFSLTEEEARAAVSQFVPVANKGAHVPTIFDGKMGTLDSVALAEDGKTLVGKVTIPKWLQELHGADTPLQASLEWDRQTKRIIGNTLIPNPRIEDSALMAAFAQEPSNFASTADLKTAMQTFHDVSIGAGASCNPPRYSYDSTSSTQKLHDLAKQYGATCHVGMSAALPGGILDTIKAMFGLDKPPVAATLPARAEETVPMSVTETPEIKALQDRLAAAEANNARLAADNRKTKAESLTQALFSSRHVLPAQIPALTAIFERALQADEAGGTVNFSTADGTEKKLSLTEAVRAVFTAVEPHKLTQEVSASNPMFTLPGSGATNNEDDPDGTKAAKASAIAWATRANGPKAAAN